MPWTCFRERMGVKNTLKIHSKHPDELLEPRRVCGLVDQSSLIESELPKQDLRT